MRVHALQILHSKGMRNAAISCGTPWPFYVCSRRLAVLPNRKICSSVAGDACDNIRPAGECSQQVWLLKTSGIPQRGGCER